MVYGRIVPLLEIANLKGAGFQSIISGRFQPWWRSMPILSVVSHLGQIQAMLATSGASHE